jgi:hypothetical protein
MFTSTCVQVIVKRNANFLEKESISWITIEFIIFCSKLCSNNEFTLQALPDKRSVYSLVQNDSPLNETLPGCKSGILGKVFICLAEGVYSR